MLIAQISDTHIVAKGRKTYGIAPTAENLSRSIQHLNQSQPPADVVVISGDITNYGQDDEYQHAKQLLDQLNAPYYVIAGNHDQREKIKQHFGASHCPITDQDQASGFIQYIVDQFAIRLIMMDSIIEGESGAEICEQRLAWLKTQLDQDQQKPCMIFMHHPPLRLSVLETDQDDFIGVQKLAALVENYPHIERIACGHVHLISATAWHGTLVSTAPSIGTPLLVDLSMTLPSQFYLGQPAYQLHYWSSEKNLITHNIQLSQQPQHYLFEEQP